MHTCVPCTGECVHAYITSDETCQRDSQAGKVLCMYFVTYTTAHVQYMGRGLHTSCVFSNAHAFIWLAFES